MKAGMKLQKFRMWWELQHFLRQWVSAFFTDLDRLRPNGYIGFMKAKKAYRPARQFVQKLLKNSEIRILFEEERAKTEIAMAVKEARLRAGLTQIELAKKAETTQAVISRIESGTDSRIPSLALLARIAGACKARLMFGFDFKKSAVA